MSIHYLLKYRKIFFKKVDIYICHFSLLIKWFKSEVDMKKVILFINSRCGHSNDARQLLIDKGVSFEEKDVEDPEVRNELLEMNVKSVPTFVIGKEVVIGIKKDELDRLLDN
jgi:glutaredoxin